MSSIPIPFGMPVELWQSLLVSGGDDAPRWILADWLEEHDFPERAELIRLQCHLARADDPDDRWQAERREDLLLFRHRATWASQEIPLRRWIRIDETLDRGLFTRVRLLDVQEGFREFAELAARWPIEELALDNPSGEPVPTRALAESAPLRCLRRLNCLRLTNDADIVPILESAQIAQLQGLTTFSLTRENANLHRILTAISQWRVADLTLTLDFSGFPVLNAVLRALANSQVQHLHFAGVALSEAMIYSLADSALVAGLQSLDLSDRAIRTIVLNRLLDSQSNWGLRQLDLSHNFIDANGATALAEARGLSYLESLNLSRNPLGVTGVTSLFDSPILAGLRQLTLSGTRIYPTTETPTDASFAEGLRLLNFSRAGLDATAISRLRQIAFPRLVTLILDRNPLGSEGVAEVFRWLPNLPNLRTLSLRDCMLPADFPPPTSHELGADPRLEIRI
ncbi:TIGR02996 domain-containing protein [Tuwongella immobilis]|uniref:Repeat-companion domain protein n=1 Tax=Tuwongella immobilis TaxID=692036 RepID=A0A6C2YHY2_9BACT|nr:TIGR02996 domain-containing protein [Tuwongella immobilis]VIP01140.1 Uncharacterized protein OS=Nitrospina gracilis (strain 3/211) GN=NITGR_980084 PE=4 SV=1: LRR_6: LRR_6: LRR_6 [Tuwongella immobilis]VTR97705.1 Uncharacterized protein OS=Nitrospina gracilis (strain 3/211) GN=NITGR_980084 PE=4 SV=1: LRR_6: LRR_6: LRR_6 [Tuwongella immobilis]